MIRKIVILLLVCMGIGSKVDAQTFHAIIFCNTLDSSIGNSMKIEYNNLGRHMSILEEAMGDDYIFNIMKLDGSTCTRANLKAMIDDMEIGPDDVVFTYYGGHGSHAPNNEEDPWPQYCMNTGFENQSNWVPMATLEKWIAAKNPRLRVIMSNCCNYVQSGTTVKGMWAADGRTTPMDGIDGANLKKLFSAKGSVMATSSKLGQYSWCNDRDGGIYTNIFLNNLVDLGKGRISADWETLLSKSKEATDVYPIIDREGKKWAQNPYYVVNIGNGSKTPKPRIDDTPKPRNDGSLESCLNMLVDKTIPQERRLGMIDSIISRFLGGKKVVTIAADMKTGVDYEEPIDFLRRICLSDYISGMSVLSENGRLVQVHELK